MQETNSREIKALSILHIALFAGQVLFALIALFIAYIKNVPTTSALQLYSNQLMMLCVAIGIAGYLGGNIIFRKKLEQINVDSKPVPQKFNDYRSACVMRWVLIEFSVLFSIILFFISHIPALLIIAAIFILLFFTTRPSLQKTASDLGISEAEIEQMNTGSSL